MRQQVVVKYGAKNWILYLVSRGKASVSRRSVSFADVVRRCKAAGSHPANDCTFTIFSTPYWPCRDCRRFPRPPEHCDFELQPNGQSNWVGAHRSIGARPDRHPSPCGIFRNAYRKQHCLRDEARKLAETLHGVEFSSLAWPSISKSFGVTGHFIWHDAPMDGELRRRPDFPAALAGSRSGPKLRISGANERGRFRRRGQFQTNFEGRRTQPMPLHCATHWCGRDRSLCLEALGPFRGPML